MEFQILNGDGIALTLKELDQQAAEFWGVQVDIKKYAYPDGYTSADNWFDVIGWIISRNKAMTWDEVISGFHNIGNSLLILDGKIDIVGAIERYSKCMQVYTPFFKLVEHWISKGYTPKGSR